MGIYATAAEVDTWLTDHGLPTLTASESERLIRLAEEDIDAYSGPQPQRSNFRKFGTPKAARPMNPPDLDAGLDVYETRQLMLATCAQVSFRLQMGSDFFIEDQRATTTTPDGTEAGKLPKIGPLARRELANTGLVRLTGKFRSPEQSGRLF